MRLTLELLRRLIFWTFVAATLALLARTALELPHPEKWDALKALAELRRLGDPVITEFGSWIGLKWSAGQGVRVPLILAAIVFFAGGFLNGRLRGLIEWLAPRPEPQRTPAAPAAANGTSATATRSGATGTTILGPAAAGGTTRIGRYEVQEEIGAGAMGVVFKALDPQIGRTVAIKTIRSFDLPGESHDVFKRRFMVEARSAGRLSHPGIVTVHDFTEDDAGHPCLVMEYIEGQTLEHLVQSDPPPLDRLLDIMIQVSRALHYAHGKGVVHRDIKPANIMVTQAGEAKVSDFGIAKLAGTELTLTGQIIGTPAFMSPEQVVGGSVDARSDIFSLGSVLYWLATAERPFTGDTVTNIAFKVVQVEPVPPRILNPTLPDGLEPVILRCLAKKPENRYPDAGELAADLEKLRAAL